MTRYTDSVRSTLRERLLDAAYGLVADAGWAGLRMAHVAERAGVSRQTVYTEFGNKDVLGQSLVMREVDRFLDGIREVLDEHGSDLRAGVTAGIEFTLRTAADNALLKTVITSQRGGDGELIAHLTTRSEPLLDTATAMLGAYAAHAWPEVDEYSRELAVECVVRLTVSNIVQPVAPPEQTARRIATIVTRVALLDDAD
ncbi:TetR family transcriptional regulator [Catenulispora yoronensis]|uniref:TetR family transcriptional regulator n=1 Tax=Catenulispora yoronensis TaxID=450799 RepID=A0ABN2VDW6_9ACTN